MGQKTAINFAFYEDASLTIPVTGNLTFQVAEDGSSGWVVTQLWLGSTIADRKVQDEAIPGVNDIQIILQDLGGIPGLSTADSGLSLDNISYVQPTLVTGVTEVESGVANALSFYVRARVFGGATPGSYIDLRVRTQALREIAI